VTEKEIVKTLFNAKTQAEDAYRNNLIEFKPVIYESQIDGMREISGGMGGWGHIENWIRSEWDVVDDKPQREAIRASWAKIHKLLDDEMYKRFNLHGIAPMGYGKTWLGSQIEQQHRMAEDRKVSAVRNRGYSLGPVIIDEANRLTTRDERPAYWEPIPESDAILIEEWLQLRSVCRRTLPCGIP
jgi:hypothetical protein